jgi:hypothetical protein
VVYVCGVSKHEYEFELFHLVVSLSGLRVGGGSGTMDIPVEGLCSLRLVNLHCLLPALPAHMHPNIVNDACLSTTPLVSSAAEVAGG